jgi:hypothetical protein
LDEQYSFASVLERGASIPTEQLIETVNGRPTSFYKVLSSLEAEPSAMIKLSPITDAKIGKVFHGCDPLSAAPFGCVPGCTDQII